MNAIDSMINAVNVVNAVKVQNINVVSDECSAEGNGCHAADMNAAPL